MKLKMLVSMAGVDFVVSAGETTERFDGDEAKRLLAAGYAVAVEEKPERAVKAPPVEKRVAGEG